MELFWYLLAYVPPWIWFIVVFVASGVLYIYFVPIINVVLAIMPCWLKIAIGAVVSIVAAVVYGRYQGAKTEREMQKKREADAVQTRSKIDESVKSASDNELDRRLDRWMRRDE